LGYSPASGRGTSMATGRKIPAAGLAALLMLLSACGKSDKPAEAEKKEAAESAGLTLKDEEIKGLGLTIQPAVPAEFRGRVDGYGVVTPLDAIAQADSEFLTTQAAASQS